MYNKVGDYVKKSSQLMKGIIEGVVLKIIFENETYGYEIYQKLNELGFDDFSEGSLYPLLLRLERKKYINSIKRQSPLGPDRKYYFLTNEGIEILESFKGEWFKLKNNMDKLWGE